MKTNKRNKIYLILFFPYILLCYLAIRNSNVNNTNESSIVLSLTILVSLTALFFCSKLYFKDKKRKEDC